MTAREVTQVLNSNGFVLQSQSGSHQKWICPGLKVTLIVPWHKGKTLPLGTLRAIQRQSGLPESVWETE
jgi:predicted RNA binding protein YcfA (HicA-like mRNA interferase family)